MASKRLIGLLQDRLGMNASTAPPYEESHATSQAVIIHIYLPNHASSQDLPYRNSKHKEHEVEIGLLQDRLGMNASTAPPYKEQLPAYEDPPATGQAVINIYPPNYMRAAIPPMLDMHVFEVGNLFSTRPTIRYSKKLPRSAIADTTLQRPREQSNRKWFQHWWFERNNRRSKEGRERNRIAERPSRN